MWIYRTFSSSSAGGTGRVGILPASGVTAGSTYAVVSDLIGDKYLQLKANTTYTIARASALAAGLEWGRTWVNPTRLDAADQNTTTANAFYWDHGNTSTDWIFAGVTAPYYYWSVTLNDTDRIEYIVRVLNNGDQDYECAGICLADNASPNASYILLRLGFNGGVKVFTDSRISGGTSFSGVTVTAAERNAGVWLKLVVQGGFVYTYYNTSAVTTPPSGGWLQVANPFTAAFTIGAAVQIGLHAMTVNPTNTFTATFLYEKLTFEPSSTGRTGIQWSATLLDTSATEQVIGEVDFGSAVSLNQTVLRQLLVDATNARSTDSATVTYSVVGSATPGPASGAYAAANAVTVTGSYQYWRVYCKIASATGFEQGSVMLPLFLPVA